MNDEVKKEVLDIMTKHELCVISTVSAEQKPESAIVAFSHSENLQLLIGTSGQSRKYANMQVNPHVAVVIGDHDSEVQYEGTARHLEGAELETHFDAHFAELPGSAKYRDDPTQVYLLITPTWLRLTVHEKPDRVEELRFAS